MKTLADTANFRLIFRRPVRLDDGVKPFPVEVLGEIQFPYTILGDNCSLLKFILEYAEMKGDDAFITDVYMCGAMYCTISFQYIKADDGDYTKFFIFSHRHLITHIVD